MNKEAIEDKIRKTLEWAYEKALDPGVRHVDSAEDLANKFRKPSGSLENQVNALIRGQNTRTGTAGFVSGLGGFVFLPVTLPTTISYGIFLQVRMIAAIAIMGDYDVRDEKVKTLVLACLCGNAVRDLLTDVGIQAGVNLTQRMVYGIPIEVIREINKAIGFKLVAKFGQKGGIHLGRLIPVVGGIACGAMDALANNVIGKVAKDVFIHKKNISMLNLP
ncbi:MAG: EcsC family protein [SAR324 cluster bacterium]|nr:EcsC family protein [SAR324 cluster bacterium]